jgi:hypothetical protein
MTVIKNLGRHTAAREAADGAPRRGSSSRAADGVADLLWWQAELPVQTAVADLVGAASDEWRGGARPPAVAYGHAHLLLFAAVRRVRLLPGRLEKLRPPPSPPLVPSRPLEQVATELGRRDHRGEGERGRRTDAPTRGGGGGVRSG